MLRFLGLVSRPQIVLWAALVIVIAVLAYIAPAETRNGVWINLFTEIVGIYITVHIVDRLLDAHEQERWSPVDALVEGRLVSLGTSGVTRIRSAFGVLMAELVTFREQLDHAEARTDLYLERIGERFEPSIASRARRLTPSQWETIEKVADDIAVNVEQTLSLIGHRISPVNQARLLQLHDSCRLLSVRFEVLPEAFNGAPIGDELDEDLREGHIRDVSKHLGDFVRLLRELAQLGTGVAAA